MHLVQILHSYGKPQITRSNNVLNFEFQKLHLKTKECLKQSGMIQCPPYFPNARYFNMKSLNEATKMHINNMQWNEHFLYEKGEIILHTWRSLWSALPHILNASAILPPSSPVLSDDNSWQRMFLQLRSCVKSWQLHTKTSRHVTKCHMTIHYKKKQH
jgi:hypothetical protein